MRRTPGTSHIKIILKRFNGLAKTYIFDLISDRNTEPSLRQDQRLAVFSQVTKPLLAWPHWPQPYCELSGLFVITSIYCPPMVSNESSLFKFLKFM